MIDNVTTYSVAVQWQQQPYKNNILSTFTLKMVTAKLVIVDYMLEFFTQYLSVIEGGVGAGQFMGPSLQL